jgi:hypothetical protein
MVLPYRKHNEKPALRIGAPQRIKPALPSGMRAILGNDQGTIEESLLALKCGYVVFLPTLGDIALIPIKPNEVRETIHRS